MAADNISARSRVLVVDDDEPTRLLLQSVLSRAGFEVTAAAGLEEMRRVAGGARPVAAVILDLFLGQTSALGAIPGLLAELPAAKVLVLSGQGTIDLAVAALRLGAVSFLTKPVDPDRLLSELRAHVGDQRGAPKADLEREGLVGCSASMRQLGVLIPKIARVDAHVLVLGESGTGKELVARALHRLSRRRDHRFEGVNCAAIPESLFESLMFGHAAGAFTGAKSDQRGLFEACSGGTLFLDEIGDMPLSQQAKLLRVLQEREVLPVGRTRAVPVDTRIVAATNRHLRQEVASGRFREDLFYRLSVVDVALAPLRERREDIPRLAQHFIAKLSAAGAALSPLSDEVLAHLCEAPWPGNVRELRHCLERAAVLAENGVVTIDDLGLPVAERVRFVPVPSTTQPLAVERDSHEAAYLRRALADARGNVAKAARTAGKPRSDMYRLFAKYRLDPNQFRDP